MKKQIAAVALAGALALGAVGCGQQQSTAQSTAASTASTASTAESTAASTASTAPQVSWTDAENADKAAEGAKLVKFGVPGDITVDGVKYENPKFAYSDGTAQATYTTNGSSLVVRKANKDSKVAVTDIDTAKAEANWIKSYENIDVTCYGPAKGAAYAIVFRDGDVQYGVTRQGSGDQKPTMDSDDVAAVVKVVKEANAIEAGEDTKANQQSAPQNTQAQSTAQSTQQSQGGSAISEEDATTIAISAVGWGLPNEAYAKLHTQDGYYYVVTMTYDGVTKLVAIDASTGAVINITEEGSSEAAGTSQTAGDSQTTDSEGQSYIGEVAAEQAALASLGLDGCEGISAILQVGGDAAHYDVTITTSEGTQTVQVDAYTGQAWN